MPTQLNQILVGTVPNDGSGDNIRDAFVKVNQNTAILTSLLYVNTYFQTANIPTLKSTSANLTSITSGNITTGNINASGMIYVNGSPVSTSLQSFNGGTVPGVVTFSSNVTMNANLILSSSGLKVTGNVTLTNASIGNLTVSNINVAGGSGINGTSIGLITPAAGRFTTLSIADVTVANVKASGSVVTIQNNTQVSGDLYTTGMLTVDGDTTINGDLTVNGLMNTVNSTQMTVEDPVIDIGTGANGADLTSADGLPRGIAMHYYYNGQDKIAFMGLNSPANRNFYLYADSTYNSTSKVYSGTLGNLIAAGYTGSLYTSAQPNVTSLGTLTGLNISGDILPSANLTVNLGSLTAQFGNIYGTAARSNQILSKGVYTSLDSILTNTNFTGTIRPEGIISSGNIQARNIIANVGIYADTITANAISVGSGGGLNNVSIGLTTPAAGYFTALRSNASPVWTQATLTDAQQLGNSPGYLTSATGVASFNTRRGSVELQYLDVITALGFVPANTGGTTYTGPLLAGSINTDLLTVGNIVNQNSGTIGNIGTVAKPFNTLFAKATSAQYADLAEKYLTDHEYPIGTVISIGGNLEATASQFGDLPIGVVSANPAYLMNDSAGGQAIALKGRVPVRVVGPVKKGQRLIPSTTPGVATAGHVDDINVFGIALGNTDSTVETLLEAVIL